VFCYQIEHIFVAPELAAALDSDSASSLADTTADAAGDDGDADTDAERAYVGGGGGRRHRAASSQRHAELAVVRRSSSIVVVSWNAINFSCWLLLFDFDFFLKRKRRVIGTQ
jgi:hypothetical protein